MKTIRLRCMNTFLSLVIAESASVYYADGTVCCVMLSCTVPTNNVVIYSFALRIVAGP